MVTSASSTAKIIFERAHRPTGALNRSRRDERSGRGRRDGIRHVGSLSVADQLPLVGLMPGCVLH